MDLEDGAFDVGEEVFDAERWHAEDVNDVYVSARAALDDDSGRPRLRATPWWWSDDVRGGGGGSAEDAEDPEDALLAVLSWSEHRRMRVAADRRIADSVSEAVGDDWRVAASPPSTPAPWTATLRATGSSALAAVGRAGAETLAELWPGAAPVRYVPPPPPAAGEGAASSALSPAALLRSPQATAAATGSRSSYGRATARKLLDTFGDSLKHVNRLFNRRYGNAARKVPAHMPHMIDRNAMAELQALYPNEYERTSSHALRSPLDMQYGFAFFYYLVHEPRTFDLRAMFDTIDTDRSGDLSDNEVITLAAVIYDLPLDREKLTTLWDGLYNCTRNVTDVDQLSPDYGDLTFEVVANCTWLVDRMNATASKELRYKTQTIDDSPEIAFHMIGNNATKVRRQLDGVRKARPKFVCLNDDIDHRRKSSEKALAELRRLYLYLFPVRSEFEIEPQWRNRFLYKDEMDAWVQQSVERRRHITLAVVALLSAVLLYIGAGGCSWCGCCAGKRRIIQHGGDRGGRGRGGGGGGGSGGGLSRDDDEDVEAEEEHRARSARAAAEGRQRKMLTLA